MSKFHWQTRHGLGGQSIMRCSTFEHFRRFFQQQTDRSDIIIPVKIVNKISLSSIFQHKWLKCSQVDMLSFEFDQRLIEIFCRYQTLFEAGLCMPLEEPSVKDLGLPLLIEHEYLLLFCACAAIFCRSSAGKKNFCRPSGSETLISKRSPPRSS